MQKREQGDNGQSHPVDMLLFCPRCGDQHVDAPQPELGWTNPPHRSHECHECGYVWRPADVPTNGVRAIQTSGTRDGSAQPARGFPAIWDDAVQSVSMTLAALAHASQDAAHAHAELEPVRMGLLKASVRRPGGEAAIMSAALSTAREALDFYADGSHFALADPEAWDTVSGEPQNFMCDEAGTATVEDGWVAKHALAAMQRILAALYAGGHPPLIQTEDECRAEDGPLAELDVLLAQFHQSVWDSAGKGDAAVDLAGNETAKTIQRHVRGMLRQQLAAGSARRAGACSKANGA